ncbi:MAG: hypothetical protein JEY99_18300 [Spirochaetales bacterium]|nr:hypothetical protein [Spirochaetales bacterium]
MKLNSVGIWFFLITFILAAPLSALEEIRGFVFDDEAVLYYPGQVYSYKGYDIKINNNPVYPYIYIREPGELYVWATFDWAFQYWGASVEGFDRDSFDITGLYLSIALSKEELDRFTPDMATKNALNQFPVDSLVINNRSEGQANYNPDHRYDPDFILNNALTELSGYSITIHTSGWPIVSFMNKELPGEVIASYNYERQYWLWTLDSFDYSSIDLRPLYNQIDLSRTELNRPKPDVLSLWGYLDAEKIAYNDPNDKDFQDFIGYLEANDVPAWQIGYYRKSASNPAKRGAEKNPRYFYEESEVGFQPIYFNEVPEDVGTLSNGTILAGGMQLYFEHHKFEKVPFFDDASYYLRTQIRRNSPIQLTLVEIYPPDGTYSGTLSGPELQGDIELRHEEKFGVEFSVQRKQVTLDYNLFKPQPGEDFLSNFDRVLDANIHSRFGTDNIFLYHFTDEESFAQVDSRLAHPRIHGAYVANWEENRETYFHELGHVLHLYHHFESVANAGKLEAHLSIPCIMNYREPYISDEFCPLCTYALGLVPPANSRNPLSEDVRRYFKVDDSRVTLYKYDTSGDPVETGHYNFGGLQVFNLKSEKDFIVFHYGYPNGDHYLGRFSEEMVYLAEYNMGNLDIYHYLLANDVVYAVYKNSRGNQYLGAFDDQMKFTNELLLDDRTVISLTVTANGLDVGYRNGQPLSESIPFFRLLNKEE